MKEGVIEVQECVVLVVDVQEKLMSRIAGAQQVERNAGIIAQAARALDVPCIATEQHPQGLGRTVETLREHLGDAPFLEKTAFSGLAEEAVHEALRKTERDALVLCGVEAHVCVLQTALDALDAGMRVAVAADAVGSRREENRLLALERMRAEGVTIASTEMILFEWLRDAKHPRFRDIQRLIK